MSVTTSAAGRAGASALRSDLPSVFASSLPSGFPSVLAAACTAGCGAGAAGAGLATDGGFLDTAVAAISEPLNIGAGCWPVWNHKPFTRIAMAATAAKPKAMASLRRHRKACSTNQRRSSSSSSAAFLPRAPLRTDLHPLVVMLFGGWRAGVARLGNPGAFARAFAIDRQANGDAGALPKPALDANVAAVQRQQALDDRNAEPGAVMAAVVGRARLEERIADARQVLGVDTDARVGNGHRDAAALVARAHRHLAAGIGELDGVGDQVEHDLIERALVGDDVGQIVCQPRSELDPLLARLEGQKLAAVLDHLPGREWLRPDLEISGLDLRHVEDTVHHRQ